MVDIGVGRDIERRASPLNITDLIMHEAAAAALGGTRPNNNSVSEIKQIISRYLHFYRDNRYRI